MRAFPLPVDRIFTSPQLESTSWFANPRLFQIVAENPRVQAGWAHWSDTDAATAAAAPTPEPEWVGIGRRKEKKEEKKKKKKPEPKAPAEPVVPLRTSVVRLRSDPVQRAAARLGTRVWRGAWNLCIDYVRSLSDEAKRELYSM